MTDTPERDETGSAQPENGHRLDYTPLSRAWPPHPVHVPGPTEFGAPSEIGTSSAPSATTVAEALIAANQLESPVEPADSALPERQPEPESEPNPATALPEREADEIAPVSVPPVAETTLVRAAEQEPDPADRPRLTDAVRHHPVALLFPIVALVLAAIAVGILRAPQHKAEARLLVGTLDIKAQAVPGYVTATEQLADSYSRLGPTAVVLHPAAAKLGVRPGILRRDVTITALPQNPIVRVIAEASSARTAAAEANAVADSLRSYVGSLGSTYSSAATIVSDYGSAAHDYEILAVRRDGLRDTLAQLRAPASDLSKGLSVAQRHRQIRQTSARLAAVSEQADAAQLVMNGNAAAYNQRLQDQRQPQTLSSLGRAVNNGTDRKVFLEQALAVAVILGILIGLPYALRRERHMRSAEHVDSD